jgi:hypothetical protein
MRSISRSVLISLGCLCGAGIIYLLGRLEDDRMVSAGQGWEMAFYWSPLVFLAIDALLVAGTIAGLIGFAMESGVHRRLQGVLSAIVCVAVLLALPWR